MVFGTWWGHVGFDDAQPDRLWSEPEIEAVRAAAGIIAAAIDRDRAQERLVAVQRMEAVGSLAGGLAHDFGNVLTAVIGNAELIKLRALPDDAREDAEAILEAAGQGSSFLSAGRQVTLASGNADGSGASGAGGTRESLASLLSWAIFGAGVEWSRGGRERSAEEWAREVVSTLVDGVARVVALPAEASLPRRVG